MPAYSSTPLGLGDEQVTILSEGISCRHSTSTSKIHRANEKRRDYFINIFYYYYYPFSLCCCSARSTRKAQPQLARGSSLSFHSLNNFPLLSIQQEPGPSQTSVTLLGQENPILHAMLKICKFTLDEHTWESTAIVILQGHVARTLLGLPLIPISAEHFHC